MVVCLLCGSSQSILDTPEGALWTAARHLSRKARKASTSRTGLVHSFPAILMPILPLHDCHLAPVSGEYCPAVLRDLKQQISSPLVGFAALCKSRYPPPWPMIKPWVVDGPFLCIWDPREWIRYKGTLEYMYTLILQAKGPEVSVRRTHDT